VLRRLFGVVKGEVTGVFRKLHTEQLNNFYSSLYINRMMKSREGHAKRMGKK
jgi:hypothetical protein